MATLTPDQRTALKAAILAEPTLETKISGPSTDYGAVAEFLNAPTETQVFKSRVALDAIGDALAAADLDALSTEALLRLHVAIALSPDGLTPSRGDRRALIEGCFPDGSATRANLTALWSRPATRAEALLLGPVGKDATSAPLVVEGDVAIHEIGGILA